MKTIRLNTALIPNKEANDESIRLSKAITDVVECEFVLDGKLFFPHVTLYSPEYPVSSTTQILKLVEKVSQSQKIIRLRNSQLKLSLDGGVGLMLKRNKTIDNFNNIIVDKLNPLRKGVLREKYLDKSVLDSFNSEQRSNIEIYGYPYVMNLFNPHITITYIKNPEYWKKARFIKTKLNSVTLNKIGIFEMGPHGTCTKLIAEFALN